ncbi:UDP-glycosyltransferase 89B1-like [Ananas comosus]|uniref:UDP-glycosyltransferase 89B1-like n=1 Tax=Ananas comosus TaxID=4615 RepID=A0A6P5FRD2_ANACO|nr:UDP-glycosyltransferase 89B1-like [Ananas comosus]
MAETHDGAPHLLVIPFPAQGHMLPLFDLAHLLARRGVAVTVAVSSGNLPLLSPLLSKSPSIQPLSLPLSHPSLAPGLENAKDMAPTYFGILMLALASLHGPLVSWARAHPRPVCAVVFDFFVGWAQPLAAELGVPGFVFSPSGVLGTAVIHSLFLRVPKRPESEGEGEDYLVPFPSIPNSPSYPLSKLSRLFRSYKEGDPLSESVRRNFLWNLESHGFVANSFEALEAAYLERPLDDLARKRVWAVGPLVAAAAEAGAADHRGGPSSVPAAEVSAWLDRSGAVFVWAARGGTEVPEGFDKRVGGRGLVLRGWAPQVAILAHAAVGWFVTHCGWNSLVEAASAGVAMLTWPMTADQHVNARLLVEEAGVALPACDGGLAAVPDPHELARTLAEAVRGERGRAVRDRAKELGRKAVEAVREGGSSYRALEEFVQELHNLNAKNN